MSEKDTEQKSNMSNTRKDSEPCGTLPADIQSTGLKRKRSEAGLEADDIMLRNPIRELVEKGDIGPNLHTSTTALRRIDGLDSTLSKDMARIYLTVHALRGAIRQLLARKAHQDRNTKRNLTYEIWALKRRLTLAERRVLQGGKEEMAFEKTLEASRAPVMNSAKRIKSTSNDQGGPETKRRTGPLSGGGVDEVKMSDGVTEIQNRPKAVKESEIANPSLQGAPIAIAASNSILACTENLDDEAYASKDSRQSDESGENSVDGTTKSERACSTPSDLQRKSKAEEQRLLQIFKDKPSGMRLSVEVVGVKRRLETPDKDSFHIDKKRKLGTDRKTQLPPRQRSVKNLNKASFLGKQSLKKVFSKRPSVEATIPEGSQCTGAPPRKTNDAAAFSPQHEIWPSTARCENIVQVAGATKDTDISRLQASRPSFPSSSPPPSARAVNSDSSLRNPVEEDFVKSNDVIPTSETKAYIRHVKSKLERYRAAKKFDMMREAECAKRRSDKTLSENPRRIRSSDTLSAYTSSLFAYDRKRKQISRLLKKDVRDLTEEESPKRPVIPPTIGSEIAAKVRLEGNWSDARHRFHFLANPHSKTEPVRKSHNARPSPPKRRSRQFYEDLKGLKSHGPSKLRPRKARTKQVAPLVSSQTANAA